MSSYNRYRFEKERPWTIHPIWRGIGCIWLILLPIMSYAGAWMFTRENLRNHWLPLNKSLTSQIRLPVIDWSFLSFPLDLNVLIRWIPGQPLYNSDILFFIAFLFLGIGIMSTVYAFLYRSMAPTRGPFEAPEVDSQRRRRRR